MPMSASTSGRCGGYLPLRNSITGITATIVRPKTRILPANCLRWIFYGGPCICHAGKCRLGMEPMSLSQKRTSRSCFIPSEAPRRDTSLEMPRTTFHLLSRLAFVRCPSEPHLGLRQPSPSRLERGLKDDHRSHNTAARSGSELGWEWELRFASEGDSRIGVYLFGNGKH